MNNQQITIQGLELLAKPTKATCFANRSGIIPTLCCKSAQQKKRGKQQAVLMLPQELSTVLQWSRVPSWYTFCDLSEHLPPGITSQLPALLSSFGWADNGLFCSFISGQPNQNNGFNWGAPETPTVAKMWGNPERLAGHSFSPDRNPHLSGQADPQPPQRTKTPQSINISVRLFLFHIS